jgi:hypothetical protein
MSGSRALWSTAAAGALALVAIVLSEHGFLARRSDEREESIAGMSTRLRPDDDHPAQEWTVDWWVWIGGRGLASIECRCEFEDREPRDPNAACVLRLRAVAVSGSGTTPPSYCADDADGWRTIRVSHASGGRSRILGPMAPDPGRRTVFRLERVVAAGASSQPPLVVDLSIEGWYEHHVREAISVGRFVNGVLAFGGAPIGVALHALCVVVAVRSRRARHAGEP